MSKEIVAVKARIDETWAENVTGNGVNIFTYNEYSAEDIASRVSLPKLGGLIIKCSADNDVWTPEDINKNRGYWSMVVLAFDENARATDTDSLIEAAIDQRPDDVEFIAQLKRRNNETHEHDFNEKWLIPVSALTVIEEIESSRV